MSRINYIYDSISGLWYDDAKISSWEVEKHECWCRYVPRTNPSASSREEWIESYVKPMKMPAFSHRYPAPSTKQW